MSQQKKIGVVAGFAASLFAGAVASAEVTPDQSRAYAAELLADADSRTSLLQGGNAGYDNGAYIGDGSWLLRTNVLLQFAYKANFRDDSTPGVGDNNDFTHGFSLNRAKVRFSGNIGSPDLEFVIDGDFAGPTAVTTDGSGNYTETDGEGTFNLQNAYGVYHLDGADGTMSILFGQTKMPVIKEELVDAAHLNTFERSPLNEFFSAQYGQVLQFVYSGDTVRFIGGINDGAFTANTSFSSAGEADIGINGRVDFLFAGAWDQFNDYTAWRGQADAAYVGLAAHYQTGGDTGVGTSDVDVILYTIDAAYESDGWGVSAAFVGSHVDAAGASDEIDHFGFGIQGNVFVSDQFELFARYDGLYLDDNDGRFGPAGTDEDTYHFITAGGTYYFIPQSHAAKLTVDVLWSFDGFMPAVGNFAGGGFDGRVGLLGEEDDEVVLRAIVSLGL